MRSIPHSRDSFKGKAHEMPSTVARSISFLSGMYSTGWEFHSRNIESPIERLLFSEIYAASIFWMDGMTVLGRPWKFGEDRFYSTHGVICYLQGAIGPYRADFVFDVLMPGKERKIYVVECDGHDFHERTKKQARFDKRRDRYMAARGITVLRFTGQEIHESAEGVWREIESIITDGLGSSWGTAWEMAVPKVDDNER